MFAAQFLPPPFLLLLTYFFPVSTAGLQLTFPSRTRSIRGLTTMVLHNRVRESSSMPGFFFTLVSSLNSLLTVSHISFPVSTAGLQLTFPSRTRSIRGLTTMVLHNRVWESSSMPGFFYFKTMPLQNFLQRATRKYLIFRDIVLNYCNKKDFV